MSYYDLLFRRQCQNLSSIILSYCTKQMLVHLFNIISTILGSCLRSLVSLKLIIALVPAIITLITITRINTSHHPNPNPGNTLPKTSIILMVAGLTIEIVSYGSLRYSFKVIYDRSWIKVSQRTLLLMA